MEKVTIIGGGLVGSLLSIYLSNHGYKVEVFEKRLDPRSGAGDKGRSINLALSDRGFNGLKGASQILFEVVKSKAIPMQGRMIHTEDGKEVLQPYGMKGQNIYSISRSQLNEALINYAEKTAQVKFYFNHRLLETDFQKHQILFEDVLTGEKGTTNSTMTFGADGAFSSLRYSLQKTELFNYSQHFLEYGYKELSIPAAKNGEHQLFKNALHIWPRKSFMLIALPNLDGSFTCTLFLPFKGPNSFESLHSSDQVKDFFELYFKGTLLLIPGLIEEFSSHQTSSLVTIKCSPWSYLDQYCLIGDAAHAIVPFYGQGMNAGFEDCSILNEIIEKGKGSWKNILQEFEGRKIDTDAVAELALRNFIEMRDLVIDEKFLLRKKIEGQIQKLFPEEWIPLYTMVTFSSMPYSKALKLGKLQDALMEEILDIAGIETSWENLDFEAIIKKYKIARQEI